MKLGLVQSEVHTQEASSQDKIQSKEGTLYLLGLEKELNHPLKVS